MDFGGLLLLGLLWLAFSFFGKKRETGAPPRPRQRPEPGRPVVLPPAAPPGQGDPTQREGSRLEMFLREMERALNQAAGPAGGQASARLPEAEEVEELESREVHPEVESLEVDVRRPERAVVDRDDEAEAVEARRVAAAAARGGSLTRADHLAFDQRIRAEPADHTAVRGYTVQQLRDAVVWREILGPPKSL
jgi:hypothetical protein